MNKLLCVLALALTALVVTLNLTAADSKGRVDTRVLAGVQNNVQDEFIRLERPVWATTSLYYAITNSSDGILMCRSNATVLVHVVFPNPTNNIGRKIEVATLGACTAIVSNAVVGTFTDQFTMTNGTTYGVASNKTAIFFSTGSNWVGRLM